MARTRGADGGRARRFGRTRWQCVRGAVAAGLGSIPITFAITGAGAFAYSLIFRTLWGAERVWATDGRGELLGAATIAGTIAGCVGLAAFLVVGSVLLARSGHLGRGSAGEDADGGAVDGGPDAGSTGVDPVGEPATVKKWTPDPERENVTDLPVKVGRTQRFVRPDGSAVEVPW